MKIPYVPKKDRTIIRKGGYKMKWFKRKEFKTVKIKLPIELSIERKLVEFLKQKGVLEQFMLNSYIHAKRLNIKRGHIKDISQPFIWVNTFEGVEFWSKLDEEFNKLK